MSRRDAGHFYQVCDHFWKVIIMIIAYMVPPVKDEDATKHEIVQDNIKEKVPDEWFWLGKPIEKCNKCCYKSS